MRNERALDAAVAARGDGHWACRRRAQPRIAWRVTGLDLVELFKMSTAVQQYAAGETIFGEGEPGDYMYVIMAGEVRIHSAQGLISTYHAGDLFGEMALIDAAPRSASAQAKTDCRLVPVDEALFKYLVAENPDFSVHVMRILVERLRRSDPRLGPSAA